MENKIVMLKLVDLFPHPDNPRKNVGNITELAESIKQSGVMQNLTVVPYEGKYRVVIGHRRRAAAISAGLEEVPCVISNMDYKTQVATMLCENMQRVDLTITEQTSGIQMMLDLGEDVNSISQKTGFSESTVRRRIKIGTLPSDELKRAEARGGTLEDYIKCTEILDKAEQRKVLGYVGTRDFKWAYDNAIIGQNTKIKTPLIKSAIKKLATEITQSDSWTSKYESIGSIKISSWEEGTELIKDYNEGTEYFFYINRDYLYLYKRAEKKKKKAVKKSPKEVEADRRRKELAELSKRTFEYRKGFILEFTGYARCKDIVDNWFTYFAAESLLGYGGATLKIIKEAIDDRGAGYYPDREKVLRWADSPASRTVLAYYFSADGEDKRPYHANLGSDLPMYAKSISLEKIYKFLCELGYLMSTEEQEFLDGTHELYDKEWKK